jgi:hypothetical protein
MRRRFSKADWSKWLKLSMKLKSQPSTAVSVHFSLFLL